MAGKGYARGLLFTLLWFVAGLAVLYAAGSIAAAPNMRGFCLLWLMAWPALGGFYTGWRDAGSGFGAGARAFLLPTLIVAAAWWWLMPELWNGLLCLKAALFVLGLAALCGGAGAGFKQARLKLYPPPEPPPAEGADE